MSSASERVKSGMYKLSSKLGLQVENVAIYILNALVNNRTIRLCWKHGDHAVIACRSWNAEVVRYGCGYDEISKAPKIR